MNISSGFLLVDKPQGWTSFDVCGKVRRVVAENLGLKPKTVKVGHTGTLDPFATGLLVVAVGKATKLIPYFEKDRKVYETEIMLGATTETLDSTSAVQCVDGQSQEPTRKIIEKLLKDRFLGKIEQVPPQYSALKVDGKRAYALAREGREVRLEPRSTEVFEIKILEYAYPRLKLYVDVAAGFYVRALARDLGELLAGGGYCQTLRRIGVGNLEIGSLENVGRSLSESDLQDAKSVNQLIDPKVLLSHLSVLEIEAGRLHDFREGRAFPVVAHDKPVTFVTINSETIGLGEVIHGKIQPRILLI